MKSKINHGLAQIKLNSTVKVQVYFSLPSSKTALLIIYLGKANLVPVNVLDVSGIDAKSLKDVFKV